MLTFKAGTQQLWNEHSVLTNHCGVWVSVQTHQSTFCLDPTPTPCFSQDPLTVTPPLPIQPCNLAERFRGCYFYWIPITWLWLHLSADDGGLWLCCGWCHSGGCRDAVPGLRLRRSRQEKHRAKNRATTIIIYRRLMKSLWGRSQAHRQLQAAPLRI